MSSNGASNSAGNAEKAMYDVDKQKEFEDFRSFGNLMNRFLTENLHKWKRKGHAFVMYDLSLFHLDDPNHQLQKSIVVLAYVFRRRLMEVFYRNEERLQLNGDETYELFHSIPDRHYMYHYLVHLACLYEKTMFDNSRNYNAAGRVVVDIKKCNEARFFKQGGFKKLYIAADNINAFYDTLEASFGKKFPNDEDIFTPFTRAVNIIERRRRYKDWDKQLEDKKNPEDDPKYKHKLQALLRLNSQGYRLGYVGVNKHLSQNKEGPSNISSQTMHTSIVDDLALDEIDLNGNDFLLPSTSSDKHIDVTQDEAADIEGCLEFRYGTLLIVSENFFKKYMCSNESKLELNCKRDIKIYCPEKITEVALFSMKTLVDNIHQCEFHDLEDGIYGFDIKCFGEFDSDKIILDTSSEEEDELPSYQKSINSRAMADFQQLDSFPMKFMKYILGEYSKKENLFEALYTLVPKVEGSEESSGAIPKAKTATQTKPGSGAQGTGATPNVNTPVQRNNESNGTVNSQNTPTTSDSNNSDDPSVRRNRYTSDGKREWRKKPVKRT